MMNEYSRQFFQQLSEKEQRRFAGLEAHRLGRHGVQQVSAFYGLHPHTVRKGKHELTSGRRDDDGRVRRPGGGRKKAEIKQPALETAFQQVLREHTAGSPMDAEVRWTHLGDEAIRDRLRERGFAVGIAAVKRLLVRHHYRRRQAVKKKEAKNVPERDAQFQEIAAVSVEEAPSDNPILSMDTKKKNGSGTYIGQGRSM
jgi:hypothetical protein